MMKISTRGRYATRMVVLLASQQPGASLTKFEIAAAEDISAGYVQQLMMALRLAGVVESHRGRDGGFSLSRPAEEITVADVLRAVEGLVMPAPCLAGGHCERSPDCPTRPVWDEAAGTAEQPIQQDDDRVSREQASRRQPATGRTAALLFEPLRHLLGQHVPTLTHEAVDELHRVSRHPRLRVFVAELIGSVADMIASPGKSA